MPGIRPLNCKKYGISKHRFLELYYFCLQYGEWKRELGNQQVQIRRNTLEKYCELVEQTAIEADPDLYPYLLKGVTEEGVTFNYLYTMMEIPCSKNTYYDRRKKFYWLLDQKK